jgi:hypothetical protein
MKSRAIRRHHEERIKRRVREYYGGAFRHDRRRVGIIADSRQLCSCRMCGNPRKWLDEKTLQERRHAGNVVEALRANGQ